MERLLGKHIGAGNGKRWLWLHCHAKEYWQNFRSLKIPSVTEV